MGLLKVKPSSISMFCEVHGCRKVINWAIGNPSAPRTQLMICNNCMKDLAAQIPEEFWPKEPELKDKVYPCDYCGEEFDTPHAKGRHHRVCPQNPKNEDKSRDDS
jgi:hypothetical protein